MQNFNFPVFLNVFDSVYLDFTVLVNFAIDRTMIRVDKIKKTALPAIKAVRCNQLELVVMGCLLPNDISSRL